MQFYKCQTYKGRNIVLITIVLQNKSLEYIFSLIVYFLYLLDTLLLFYVSTCMTTLCNNNNNHNYYNYIKY